MPSPNLHPLRLPHGRAVIVIAAYNYRDTTIGPYAEIPVAIPVVFNAKKGLFQAWRLCQIRQSSHGRFNQKSRHR